MNTLHYPHWPIGLPHQLQVPATSVYHNLQISALRYPDKPALIFYDGVLSYRQLHEEVLALAAWLQQVAGVRKGDRVLLDMQNCPQFVIAYYAILRADAMIVPVNPMLMHDELAHYLDDSGARVAIVAQEIMPRLSDFLDSGTLSHLLVASYADYLPASTDLTVPDFVRAKMDAPQQTGIHTWRAAIAATRIPAPHQAGPDDLACMPYTSGTTGHPKGCIHSHRSVMFNIVASPTWSGAVVPNHVALAVLPFFHVTGMQSVMNSMIYCGATLVILPRWDRNAAGELITRYGVTNWTLVPSMMIDFLSNPRLGEYDISSLTRVSGGGAAMPAAIAQKLLDLSGQIYMEGYGLSETMAPSHLNPPQRMKQQCLGIPFFNVDARVVDPLTLLEVAQGQSGEIWIHGPQVFQGYWNDAKKTAEAFAELDGKQFFRSGDLGYIDEEGFFFFTDRLKRMINASGFKVWPAEVESMMYQHPAIQECCIIASADPYRGETVKAMIVKKPGVSVTAEDISFWAHEKMAAYKVPRLIEFIDTLPKSATGKVMWRSLQEQENARTGKAN
ncbi:MULTISPECIES: long-chain fatty acid--CoA ligase [unclassified Undibacterium]|uniref:long-chain fatty acid--CoA ligase n=1 Tax=unclassified Undibacterium TaxID=2630295 RepID=UPI002AC9058B|nr:MULTISPECIES: long-chain fatty acid--CoA ligase [unclassified Undibacterium]MEB0137800.1 long-chain fatty acid--CoA ligase [Undibacterium sp. CCC2.1]MEB0171009.1 long-chain fatty acid--CoA ligase [Undibacterium sp. CCC1.1]MEB0175054.1 long-chain fatty acid--CoA ligase [Undibacterium sp. CCC3.4]MEB0215168.1 long-chain fatty acid--CoA ligase [Undibacterium sp. 5I2]WPX44859.1 long-chain fatty acid--CoA ligase [Undibacterium sp. CCC3.4]